MFYLIEGYFRGEKQAENGRLVDTKAATAVQIGGMIIRQLSRGSVNVCVVTEITEEVFAAFYQERTEKGKHNER